VMELTEYKLLSLQFVSLRSTAINTTKDTFCGRFKAYPAAIRPPPRGPCGARPGRRSEHSGQMI